jgi:hypothetical protein
VWWWPAAGLPSAGGDGCHTLQGGCGPPARQDSLLWTQPRPPPEARTPDRWGTVSGRRTARPRSRPAAGPSIVDTPASGHRRAPPPRVPPVRSAPARHARYARHRRPPRPTSLPARPSAVAGRAGTQPLTGVSAAPLPRHPARAAALPARTGHAVPIAGLPSARGLSTVPDPRRPDHGSGPTSRGRSPCLNRHPRAATTAPVRAVRGGLAPSGPASRRPGRHRAVRGGLAPAGGRAQPQTARISARTCAAWV